MVYPDWDITYERIKEDVLELGTHGFATDWLWPEEEKFGLWWRREDTILSENPYTGFEARKDWPLKEAMNMHFVRLQQESFYRDFQSNNCGVQAGLVNRKLGFTTWEWEEETIVLTLNYFALPFTILIRKKLFRNFGIKIHQPLSLK